MPDRLMDAIDDSRHAPTPRNVYVNEALIVRLYLEETGEWEDVLAEADVMYGDLMRNRPNRGATADD